MTEGWTRTMLQAMHTRMLRARKAGDTQTEYRAMSAFHKLGWRDLRNGAGWYEPMYFVDPDEADDFEPGALTNPEPPF